MRLPKSVQLPGDKRNQVIGPSLVILPTGEMKVAHEMDTVIVEIGGKTLTMDYPTALKLSLMLRQHGKQAKKFAGDASKHWASTAVLTDAEENYKRGW